MPVTNDEMLQNLKNANAISRKIREIQASQIPEAKPPEVVLPETPYVETEHFAETMSEIYKELQSINQIQASIQDISDKLESEKQARIESETDGKRQRAVETRRFIITAILTAVSAIAALVAAVAALIPLFH